MTELNGGISSETSTPHKSEKRTRKKNNAMTLPWWNLCGDFDRGVTYGK